MTNEILTFERTLNAPPSLVYRAFTNSGALREWFCDAASADPQPGGRLYFWWNDGYYVSGQFTAAEADKRIAFTWLGRDEPGPTQIEISLAPLDQDTRLTITHGGIGAGENWEAVRGMFQRGWQAGLENLQSTLETGQDLRYVRRPMLGVMVGEFNADIAGEMDVPVSEGIRLDGVIRGMGAEAAGLQKDDVIVRIGAADVTDWPSLGTALEAHHAGDKVDVRFYRGSEKRTAAMTLSGRPLPDVPESAQALSDAVRTIYEETDAKLTDFLASVSEAEAVVQPAPDDWSIKDTLAHLILSERWFQSWITDLIADSEPWYDRWGGNVSVRNAALLAVYPTVSALLEELKRSEAETIALLSALPPEFVARKSTFTRLSYNLLEAPGYHIRQHLDQMHAAVAAARDN
jgi:uncharacterized protein YndB with AHSA1/START domain